MRWDGDLDRFHKAYKAVRVQLPHDMDEELIKLSYYDQVKSLSQLRETMYHYELADEGSEGKSLATLTGAVEKILDRKQRVTNRRAQNYEYKEQQNGDGKTIKEQRV